MTTSARLLLAVTLAIALSSCGDDDGDADPTTVPSADVTGTDDAADGSSQTGDGSADGEAGTDLRATLAARGVTELVLDPATEGGSHPTLSWQPVDGAATYWLVLLDRSGNAHWAWTGSDTAVRVGGGDRAEENQTAAVFEPMTWTVSAFADDGSLLAISASSTVAP